MSMNCCSVGKSQKRMMNNAKGTHGTHRIEICTKTTRQEFPFFQKAAPIPSSKFWSLFQSHHYSGTTVFQIAISGASARWYDVCWDVLPFEICQIDNVHADDIFFHMMINKLRNIFMNDEHIVSKSLEKCTLLHETNLMKWREVPLPCSVHSLT